MWKAIAEVYDMNPRTDLAIEAKRLWDRSVNEKTKLPGVAAKQSGHCGVPIDIVEILDERGARELQKPVGTYVTVDVSAVKSRQTAYFRNAAEAVARVLHTLMQERGPVLVVGLGNREVTSDAVGPLTLSHVIVTRHLRGDAEVLQRNLACVSALAPGVLGSTGIESADLVKSAIDAVRPEALIVVDALASCEPERLCTTVQLSDTGIVPGSGVGNCRQAFTRDALGVPVYSVGVATIADAPGERSELMLTPRNIDFLVRDLAKLIGYGIDLALHPGLEIEDIPSLLS